MFAKVNKIRIILLIIFSTLAIAVLSAYFACKVSIRKYEIPFMEMQADFSKVGKYEAILNITFSPNLAIGLCVIPVNHQDLPNTIFWGLEAVIDITNDHFTYSSDCSFGRGYYDTTTGINYYCMYLPPRKIVPGKYHCVLTVIKSEEQFKNIPLKIVVYPVYDFLPMISDLLIIFFFVILLVVITLGIYWKICDAEKKL